MYAAQSDNLPPMSEAEYLAFADKQEFKYEYRAGKIYAMTGGSVRHGVITAGVSTHLSNQLGDRDCTVTSPDVRVYIANRRAYRYPDVTVFCGAPVYLEGRTDTITNPMLLVEVLSPGTALEDRNDKLVEYTQIDHLQAYVLVAQDEPKVEVFRRHEAGKWLYEYVTGLDTEIAVPVLGTDVRLSLAQIYRRVQWETHDE
jgi:Uma2 family endonuclease